MSTAADEPTPPRGPRARAADRRLLISCADRRGIVAAVSGASPTPGRTSSSPTSTRPIPRAAGSSCASSSRSTPARLRRARRALRRGRRAASGWTTALARRPAQARGADGLAAGPLPARSAVALAPWRARLRHPARRLQPRGSPRGRRDVRRPLCPHPGRADVKAAAEERLLEVLGGEHRSVVLARYMQILSRRLPAPVGEPVINIHHSFLPAFAAPTRTRRPSSAA